MHNYLSHIIAHPKHYKDIFLCNLAKRIFYFASNYEKVEMRLKEV